MPQDTLPSLFMRRTDLRNLPAPEVPAGYRVRLAHAGDAMPLAALLQRSFPEMEWNAGHVRDRLLNDPTVQSVAVIECSSLLVATASARLLPETYPGSGYVHWVGADPDHRGKRLGYHITLFILQEFVHLGCQDAVLETDDWRTPAIRVYAKLGFRPEFRHASHADRWHALETTG